MIATVLAALIGGIAAVISALVYRKVNQVHVLVNSRMDQALLQIKDLQRQRDLAQQTESERIATEANHLAAERDTPAERAVPDGN